MKLAAEDQERFAINDQLGGITSFFKRRHRCIRLINA
jgi:hypothetical protein